MSMGIGHNYWVQMIKTFHGTLEQCLEWMDKNKPANNLYWFELHPKIQWKKDKRIKVDEYGVDLVTDGNLKNRDKI